VRRHVRHSSFDVTTLVATAAGAVLGVALGYLAGGSVGRVNARRIRGAVDRMRNRDGSEAVWTQEAAERLEARVLDALSQDVVLARRPIRVTVLGLGLVELTGSVLHGSEIGLASDIVERVEGVDTVLNHLVVVAPDRSATPSGGPKTPRAARG
jgi:hypothetical protein